jgi:lysozyme
MITSKIGIDLIKYFEGLHDGDLKQIGLQPKKCPAGIWTEGWGIAMRDSNGNFLKGNTPPKGTVLNEKEADNQLSKFLGAYERIVLSKVKVPLSQNQFDALVSYTYNTGGSDTLFKLINQNAPKEQIEKWFKTKYITANGKVLQGLVNRRNAECKLFFL